MNNYHLILLTNAFPYDKTETFIEKELCYLAKSFKKVTIISGSNNKDESRKLPNNCNVLNYKSKQTFYMKFYLILKIAFDVRIFVQIISQEIKLFKDTYKTRIHFSNIVLLFSTLLKAYGLYLFIKNKKLCGNALYSYWFDYKAVAISIYKIKNIDAVCLSRAHRGDLYAEELEQGYIPLQKFKSSKLSKIFFISNNGLKYFTDKINADTFNLSVSRLGVSIPNLNKVHNNPNKLIVSCSFISPVKRIHLIIEALTLIKNINCKWVHIGDGPMLSELESLAKKKLKNSNISYEFLGSLKSDAVLSFYEKNSVSAFINVSESEGIPVSIMEAAAYKIPIIATDVGGTSEFVNNTNGVLLNSNFDVQILANEIERILNLSDKELYKLREGALNTVKELFNIELNYSQFTQQLLNLCNEI